MSIKKTGTTEPRRKPIQERAKATVDRILAAAEYLAATEGPEAMQMRRIALSTGLPIGSIYMYFPNRESILRAITDKYHALIDAALEQNVSEVKSAKELLELVMRSVDEYYIFIRSTPAVLNLWTGSSYNKLLAELSINDSKRTAAILLRGASRFLSARQREHAGPGFLVCVDMIGSISLVAAAMEPAEGDKVVAEMRSIIQLYVSHILRL